MRWPRIIGRVELRKFRVVFLFLLSVLQKQSFRIVRMVIVFVDQNNIHRWRKANSLLNARIAIYFVMEG